jgi:hypothetical protein
VCVFAWEASVVDQRRRTLLAALASWPLFSARLGAAEEGADSAVPFTPPDEFQELVTSVVREQLPDKYEKSKNWGQTKRVWAGVKLELDGLRLETRRRYREVNDGPWQKYRIDVIQPEKHFHIELANIRQADNKVLGNIAVDAKLHVFGRHSQWESGVQLFSVSADATARVRLKAALEVATRIDATKVPPDLLFSPRVTSADLAIVDFELERVSDLHGPLVESLSSTVREVLEDKLAEKRQKLVEKINKSLAKRQDKFRLSAADALKSPWGKLLSVNSGSDDAGR